MRLLFISSTRIGDAVLSTGALAALLERHPGARVTVASGRIAASLFAAVPGLERVIPVDKRAFALHWPRLWAQTALQRWDLIVDLRASAIAHLLWAGERKVLRRRFPRLHRVEELARGLGLDAPCAPRIWTTPRHDQAAADLLPADDRLLAIAPAANWLGKQWRAERFAELAKRLTAPGALLSGGRVVVFAAESERAQVQPVFAALPDCVDLVGQADLLTVAASLARCAFFVGNDSGLMHLAAAVGTPTLGLFGPSPEWRYRPWGPRCAYVRTPESYDNLASRPGFPDSIDATLMDGLGVDTVEAAAAALWRADDI